MESIKVTSQNQLDKLPTNYIGRICVCFGTPINPAIIRGEHKYATILVAGHSCAVVMGDAHIIARDSSSVVALGGSTVAAHNSSHVEARDVSSVVAFDYSTVVAWDRSHVEARGHVCVDARDDSEINVVMLNNTIVARDNSKVEAWSGNNITALGNATVLYFDL